MFLSTCPLYHRAVSHPLVSACLRSSASIISSSSLPRDSRAVSGGAPAVGSTGAVRWPGSVGGARRGTSGASAVQERRGAVSSGGGRYGGGSAQSPGLVGRSSLKSGGSGGGDVYSGSAGG